MKRDFLPKENPYFEKDIEKIFSEFLPEDKAILRKREKESILGEIIYICIKKGISINISPTSPFEDVGAEYQKLDDAAKIIIFNHIQNAIVKENIQKYKMELGGIFLPPPTNLKAIRIFADLFEEKYEYYFVKDKVESVYKEEKNKIKEAKRTKFIVEYLDVVLRLINAELLNSKAITSEMGIEQIKDILVYHIEYMPEFIPLMSQTFLTVKILLPDKMKESESDPYIRDIYMDLFTFVLKYRSKDNKVSQTQKEDLLKLYNRPYIAEKEHKDFFFQNSP